MGFFPSLKPIAGVAGLSLEVPHPLPSLPRRSRRGWFSDRGSGDDQACSFGCFCFFLNHLMLRSNIKFIRCYKTKPRANSTVSSEVFLLAVVPEQRVP